MKRQTAFDRRETDTRRGFLLSRVFESPPYIEPLKHGLSRLFKQAPNSAFWRELHALCCLR